MPSDNTNIKQSIDFSYHFNLEDLRGIFSQWIEQAE